MIKIHGTELDMIVRLATTGQRHTVENETPPQSLDEVYILRTARSDALWYDLSNE
jgi:hypothetical protein